MILLMDVGNTHTVMGVFRRGALTHHWRLATRPEATTDDLGTLVSELFTLHRLKLDDISGMAFSCVVPILSPSVMGFGERYLKCVPLMVGPGIKTGLKIRYENPREVGGDRVVNALAVIRDYGVPAVVVDFGTATTFDAVSAAGEYLGGAIAPGIEVSMGALSKRAARLPMVELSIPDKIIGQNTIESIQAGLVFGYRSMAEGIIADMKAELGQECRVVATGGWSEFFAPLIPSIQEVDPNLTLKGLWYIYDLNRPEKT